MFKPALAAAPLSRDQVPALAMPSMPGRAVEGDFDDDGSLKERVQVVAESMKVHTVDHKAPLIILTKETTTKATNQFSASNTTSPSVIFPRRYIFRKVFQDNYLTMPLATPTGAQYQN